MSKPVKDLIGKELNRRFSHLDSVLVVNPVGLNANDTTKLRAGLRGKKIEMELVKNSLAQRAFAGTTLEPVGRLLEGPSALVTGGESIVDVAREVAALARQYKALQVRGAVVEGQVLDSKGAQMLATMPTRSELQGQVAGLAQSPGARLAGQITGPAARLAGCIKARVDQLEKEGGSQAA